MTTAAFLLPPAVLHHFLLSAFLSEDSIIHCSIRTCGNVTLLDGWIFQLLTWALFQKKHIHSRSGRTVRLAVIEAGIRIDKLTPGELTEVLPSALKSPIVILGIISTACLCDGNR